MAVKSNIHIGQMLIFQGIISREQLSIALEEQKKTKDFICNILIKLGFTTEEKIYPVLAEKLGVDYVRLKDIKIEDKHALEMIPAKFAYYYKLMPLTLKNNCITVATSDPLNSRLINDLRQLLGMEVKTVLAAESDIIESIKKYYTDLPQAPESKNLQEKIKGSAELSGDALVVKIVNDIIALGIEEKATDIHTEYFKDGLKIRFKIRTNFYEISIKKSEAF